MDSFYIVETYMYGRKHPTCKMKKSTKLGQ
jgi:hypothetical protein